MEIDLTYAVCVASMCRYGKAGDLADEVIRTATQLLGKTTLKASYEAVASELYRRIDKWIYTHPG